MFAAFKILATFLVACVSVVVAVVESGHPLLIGCSGAAFLIGLASAEIFRVYRNHTVRSSVQQ